MGQNSKIEWTHHTFNPWWGCAKVSEACKNCYAEAWSKRVGENIWGVKAKRRFFSVKHWEEPLLWNQLAENMLKRKRVFCASMADIFEPRKELDEWRLKVWQLVSATPWLDWLLLTKRPDLVGEMVPWGDDWPKNVWLGTTIENQKWAEKRIPILLSYQASIRFISCEPLLGQLDLSPWISNQGDRKNKRHLSSKSNLINWVIVGGESGGNARPMNPEWVRKIRDFCIQANIPFHFKQWGNWKPVDKINDQRFRVVELNGQNGSKSLMRRASKSTCGRVLDGEVWDEIPIVK